MSHLIFDGMHPPQIHTSHIDQPHRQQFQELVAVCVLVCSYFAASPTYTLSLESRLLKNIVDDYGSSPPKCQRYLLLFLHCFPILQKLFESGFRERMLREFLKEIVGDGTDVSAKHCSFCNMPRVAGRGDEHFGLESIVAPYLHNLGNKPNAIFPRIIESTDKWRNDGCSGLGGKDCLIHRENERDIRRNALYRKMCKRLEPFAIAPCDRNFHNHMLMPLCVLFALFDHAGGIGCRYLCRNTGNKIAHL